MARRDLRVRAPVAVVTSPLAHAGVIAPALVLTVGLVAGWLSVRLGLPDVVMYLLAGIAVGGSGFGWLKPSGDVGSQLVFIFGAAFILYQGGREVDLHVLRRVWLSVTLLATTGIVVSALVIAGVGVWLLHLSFGPALLLAAVLAPTDPASIIPLFRQVRVGRKLAQTVVAESAFNDATAAALATTVLVLFAGGGAWWQGLLHFFASVAGGAAVGTTAAVVTAFAMAGARGWAPLIGQREHGPILTLLTVMAAYMAADLLGVSGFMAVFVAGLLHGNARRVRFVVELPEERALLHDNYLGVTGHLARMAIFVLLGAQVDLQALRVQFWAAALLVAALVVLARPATVLLSVTADRAAGWRWTEVGLLCWVRETGVISAALAGILAAQQVGGARLMASVVVLAILVTMVGQASSTPFVARRLGLEVQAD